MACYVQDEAPINIWHLSWMYPSFYLPEKRMYPLFCFWHGIDNYYCLLETLLALELRFIVPTGNLVGNENKLDISGVTTSGQGPEVQLKLNSGASDMVSIPY